MSELTDQNSFRDQIRTETRRNMEEPVLIRLDVMLESVKMAVMKALSERELDLESIVSAKLDAILSSRAVVQAIEDEAMKAVENEIRWRTRTIVSKALQQA